MNQKQITIRNAIIRICLFGAGIAFTLFLLTYKGNIRSDKLNIKYTNYLTLLDKIYCKEDIEISALHYPLYVVDSNLVLHDLDGKNRLNKIGELKPYSPSYNEFALQFVNLNPEYDFSSKDFLDNTLRAWRVENEVYDDRYYILFEQKDNKYFFAEGYSGNDEVASYIKVIFTTKISVQKSPTTIHD